MRRIIYKISLGIASSIIFFYLLKVLVEILIKNSELSLLIPDSLSKLFSIIFISSILYIFSGLGFEKIKSAYIILGRLLATIFVALLFLFFLTMITFDLCNWTDEKILYVHKYNSNHIILLRSYGCGAVDSASSKPRRFERKNTLFIFEFTKPINGNKINMDKWQTI